MPVREATTKNSAHAPAHNNGCGWGIPDILAAIQYTFYLTGDGSVNAPDAVYLLACLYRNGSAASAVLLWDVNCDDGVDGGDVVYLLSYLFQNGSEPSAN